MIHYLLYGHGGSYNHGSEAMVRCTIRLLRKISPDCKITLASHFPEQDRQFGIDADELVGRNLFGRTNVEIYEEVIRCITPDTVCLSMGGDNYCYANWQRYAAIHYAALEKGARSILWSCSIEPSMMSDEMLDALRTHHLIAAREAITRYTLQEHGIRQLTQIPDVAFALEQLEIKLPPEPYVALNLSPLILRIVPQIQVAYQKLINEIVEKTTWQIALVPQVEMSMDNDCEALASLEGPADRIWRVSAGLRASEYKFIFGHAEICVAARTHAAIAAWSCCVPTIAVGYSVKTTGIASGLHQESFVLDAITLNGEKLCQKFWQLSQSRSAVQNELLTHIPEYYAQEKATEIIKEISNYDCKRRITL